MEFEHGSPGAADDPSLAAWRRDAADIVLAATTLVHLPAVLLFMLGYGLPTTLTVRALVAAGYAVMIFSAFARRSMWRSEASDSPRTSLGRSAPRSAFRRAAASRWTSGGGGLPRTMSRAAAPRRSSGT